MHFTCLEERQGGKRGRGEEGGREPMISGSVSIHSNPKLIINTTAQSFQHPPPPFTLLDPKTTSLLRFSAQLSHSSHGTFVPIRVLNLISGSSYSTLEASNHQTFYSLFLNNITGISVEEPAAMPPTDMNHRMKSRRITRSQTPSG